MIFHWIGHERTHSRRVLWDCMVRFLNENLCLDKWHGSFVQTLVKLDTLWYKPVFRQSHPSLEDHSFHNGVKAPKSCHKELLGDQFHPTRFNRLINHMSPRSMRSCDMGARHYLLERKILWPMGRSFHNGVGAPRSCHMEQLDLQSRRPMITRQNGRTAFRSRR